MTRMLTSILLIVCVWCSLPGVEYEVFDPANPPTSTSPPSHMPYTASSGSFSHQHGPKTMLFVYVKPSDVEEPSQKSFENLRNELNNTSQFYYNQSSRRTWFGPKILNPGGSNQMVVPKLHVARVDLPLTLAEYRNSFSLLQSHTIAAVRNLGGDYDGGYLDPNNFDRIAAAGPNLVSSAGMAFLNGRFSVSGNTLSGNIVRHELGHNWGVVHANRWRGDNLIARNSLGVHSEYGDGADVMGGSGDFNTMFKNRLGFLDRNRGEIALADNSGTYRVFAHSNPLSVLPQTQPRSILVPITGFTRSGHKKIFLGYRDLSSTPGLTDRRSWDTHAIQVHSHNTSTVASENRGSHFIDTTPGSRQVSDHHDGAIKIGRTYSEGPSVNGAHIYGGMHITPVYRGELVIDGITHRYLDVVINYAKDIGSNASPVASFSQSIINGAVPGVPFTISVNASDPDGDTLAFDWDFGDNRYNLVNSASQTHTWQSPGLYRVTCVVSDMKGGIATAQVWVNVGDIPYRPADTPASTLAGVEYAYYEGSFPRLPNFTELLPLDYGVVGSVDISPRLRNDNFAMTFQGYIQVPDTDIYSFTLNSNDGSVLLIGDQVVIDNDGVKSSALMASGNIALEAGLHAFRVEFFHRSGSETLELLWNTIGEDHAPVPASALFRNDWGSDAGPSITITAPYSGEEFLVGSDMLFAADAAHTSGISMVQYFTSGALLGSADVAPYEVIWENVSVGEHTVRAVAWSGDGRFRISGPLTVSVVSPPPTRSIGINFGAANPETTIHYGDHAGAVYSEPNWNNISVHSGENGSLHDATGHVTNALLTWFSSGTQSGNFMTLGASDSGAGRLMRGGVSMRGNIEYGTYPNPTAIVSQIPYAQYDIYVYFDYPRDRSEDSGAQRYVVTPQGMDPLAARFGQNATSHNNDTGDYPAYEIWTGFREATATSLHDGEQALLGNYVVFRGLTSPGFTLEATRRDGTPPGGSGQEMRRFFNAVQIVETPMTKPQLRIVAPPSGWTVKEGGPAISYMVSLSHQPEASVTVSMEVDEQITTSPSSLMFTDQNWADPQIVHVQAVNDTVAEGTHVGMLSHVISGAVPFTGLQVPRITVEVLDNDTPIIGVYEDGPVMVDGPTPASFRFLRSQSTASSEITVEFTASTSTLTGNARPGIDYHLSGSGLVFDPVSGEGSIIIPAGAASAEIVLTPIDDPDRYGLKHATLTLVDQQHYDLDPHAATTSMAILVPLGIEYYTQYFQSNYPADRFNLMPYSVTFTPDESAAGYSAHLKPISGFPTPIDDHTNLATVTPDHGSRPREHAWRIERSVVFYGETHPHYWINSQGSITFAGPSTGLIGTTTLIEHFRMKRISGYLANISTESHGDMYYGRITTPGSERCVISFDQVGNWSNSSIRSSFQIELWDNGVITLSWVDMNPFATGITVGLSNRTSVPDPFVNTQFLGMPQDSGNRPPLFLTAPSVEALNIGEAFSYAVEVYDPDGDAVTLSHDPLPSWLSWSPDGPVAGILTGTPSQSGSWPITLRVSDGTDSTEQTFTITVRDPANRAPVFTSSPTPDAVVGQLYTSTISATDPDGDPLVFYARQIPGWMSLTDHGNGSATLAGTVPDLRYPDEEIELVVSDGSLQALQVTTLAYSWPASVAIASPLGSSVTLADTDTILHLTATSDDPAAAITWSRLAGPGTATFSSPSSLVSTVTFDLAGAYTLQVAADNGFGVTTAQLLVMVESDSSALVNDGLIGYWRMNDTSGASLTDSSGNDRHAVINGTVLLGQNGVEEQAISLTGTGNYAETGEVGQPDVFALSAWIWSDASPSIGDRMRNFFTFTNGSSNRALMGMEPGSSKLSFYSHHGTPGRWQVDASIPTAQWLHVAVVYDRSSVDNIPQIFINGVAATLTQIASASGSNNSSHTLRIGAGQSSRTTWNGRIDEMRLYNRAFAPEHIPLLMSVGAPHLSPVITVVEQSTSPNQTIDLEGAVSSAVDVNSQWLIESGPPGASFAAPEFPGTSFTTGPTSGIYSLRLRADDGVGLISKLTTVYSVAGDPEAPVILQQPLSLSLALGTAASVQVLASGEPPPQYQWYHNDEPITGATQATLHWDPVRMTTAGAYRVVVSNSEGTVQSNTATMGIDPNSIRRIRLGRLDDMIWEVDPLGEASPDSGEGEQAEFTPLPRVHGHTLQALPQSPQ